MVLSFEESKRYEQHLRIPEVGVAGQTRLQESSVLIVGVGGLGCPVAQYLAAMGVGDLGLVDGDVIHESNLHRQILYTAEDIGRKKVAVAGGRLIHQNPHVQIATFDEYLSYENIERIFAGYDLVIDCSDNFFCRYLVNDACIFFKIPFVSGAIGQFEGKMSVFNYRRGPCYRCVFPFAPNPKTIQNCAEAGVLGVLPGMIGMMLATEAVKLLLDLGASLSGRLLMTDMLTMSFRIIRFERNESCPICGNNASIGSLEESKRLAKNNVEACEAQPKLISITRGESRFDCALSQL